jgi:alpha-D-xyloside xylohydrolase
MVCPVYKYKAREQDIYFPSGAGWYSVYFGQFTAGNQKLKVEAPYDRMPLFAAAGSILPVGDVIQNTKENQKDLMIFVYAGKDGKFTLYEDEDVNYNYEKGAYSTIPLMYDDKGKTLTIGERTGEFQGMNRNRKFSIVYVTQEKPCGIDTPQINVVIHYIGQEQTVHF